MDLLRKENGSTIIETLVGITILGLVVALSFSLLLKLYGNANLMNKPEAFQLANQEITNAINNKTVTDTTYTNEKGNLVITRTVIQDNLIYKINVKVTRSGGLNSAQEIISLNALFTN